jgi:tRNA threonylcarbamoyladenosine biosynthesis protein TsaB
LKEKGVEMKDLSAVITVAGPGFYTGLRLSEGFADVTKFFQIPHYSFYSHEIPGWLGHEEGAWVTKAYRGEYFIYQWKGVVGKQNLIETKNLQDFKLPSEVFIHSETALDEKLRALVGNATSTLELLKSSPKKIFQHVFQEKSVRESFYFRAPEDEFRMNP